MHVLLLGEYFMRSLVLVGCVCFFGMHRAFDVSQVREMMADCKKFVQLIGVFDEQYVRTTSLQEMLLSMQKLTEGIAYCKTCSAQLDADAWIDASREAASRCDRLELAVRQLRNCIAYKSDPTRPLPSCSP